MEISRFLADLLGRELLVGRDSVEPTCERSEANRVSMLRGGRIREIARGARADWPVGSARRNLAQACGSRKAQPFAREEARELFRVNVQSRLGPHDVISEEHFLLDR